MSNGYFELAPGKALLITILATAALVAMNPLSADEIQTSSPLVLQTVELA